MSTVPALERECVIAGGGPAGMVLGYLLARAGLNVTVLEKHADFLRDFRGDTIHPSTITLLRELGLSEEFLALPLSRLETVNVVIDGTRLTVADFSTLPEPDTFLVFAPQWDFLDFLAAQGATLPGFDLRMSTEATDLIMEQGRIVGVRAQEPEGDLEVRAPLTVAADGRGSVLRARAGLHPVSTGVPIDVLWFRLPKPRHAPPPTLGYVSPRGMVLTLDRNDYYQAGAIIPKGRAQALRDGGLAAFRTRLVAVAPHLASVIDSLASWDQVKLLSVQIDRLRTWHRPGFIAIGDAAHAMSPMFGVGVNYAIQDAVALANAIHDDLARGEAPDDILAAVQRRRERPARTMQRLQRLGHRGLSRIVNATGERALPRGLVTLLSILSPLFRPRVASFIGLGFLPEHSTIR
jgi:2-polyprenyl-6-methoxyphenol hydroxylase-like FAD-dependent oxidoreductase